jgi:hypothetical protein
MGLRRFVTVNICLSFVLNDTSGVYIKAVSVKALLSAIIYCNIGSSIRFVVRGSVLIA